MTMKSVLSGAKPRSPKGPHGRAAVHALGRTKTTGNFAKIEAAMEKARPSPLTRTH
jgi:hypothetical protein